MIIKSKFKKNVMLTDENDNCISYRLGCDCGEPDHDAHIDIEYDKDLDMVSLIFYKNLSFMPYVYHHENWIDDTKELFNEKKFWTAISCCLNNTIGFCLRSFLYRLKYSLKLLATGYLEFEADLIIQEPEHIKNLIDALKEGQLLMEERKQKES